MSAQHCVTVACLVLVLAGGCSADSDGDSGAQSAQAETALAAVVTGTAQEAAKPAAAPTDVAAPRFADTAIDAAELERVAALDADAAIERYRHECHAGDLSQRCRALRRRVEQQLLEALVALRAAGQKPDPQLYRVAARAENPQLAIIGLRELMLAPKTIAAEDQVLILAALESPWAGVRQTVLDGASRLQAVSDLWPRVAYNADASAGIRFLDNARSREPDPAVAGSYPGARYRYFASDATRHWFTTPDAPEKVIAFLARDGRQALSADAFKAKIGADVQQAYMAAIMTGDEKKITQVMRQMSTTGAVDWTGILQDVGDTGEMQYIALAPDRVVAVFADNVLRATSIVALVPPPAEDIPDPENGIEEMQKRVEREEMARRILGR